MNFIEHFVNFLNAFKSITRQTKDDFEKRLISAEMHFNSKVAKFLTKLKKILK